MKNLVKLLLETPENGLSVEDQITSDVLALVNASKGTNMDKLIGVTQAFSAMVAQLVKEKDTIDDMCEDVAYNTRKLYDQIHKN